MRKRIQYSQNFLVSKKLINSLLDKSSIKEDDVVLEIGAGQGIITNELIDYCKKVVAYEIDNNLCNKLKDKFEKHLEKVEIVFCNFLKSPLPNYKYKVFANIPFNITSDIIKRLVFSANPPLDSYLIVQNEAAKKFAGEPVDNKNSLMATLIKSQFKIEIFHEFQKSDFHPKPSVNVIMLRIKALNKPLVPKEKINLFRDFVTYTYSQFEPNVQNGLSKLIDGLKLKQLAKDYNFSTSNKPSQLQINHWTALFETFLHQSNKSQKDKIKGSFKKLLIQQGKLQKIHRTRQDKDWKKFGFPKRSF